jgi:hypothetical protein
LARTKAATVINSRRLLVGMCGPRPATTRVGFAIGLKDIELRNEMRHVLEQLANECLDVGEPPMTALVVNGQTGAPGAGWHGNGEPWHADVQRVFRYWAAQS